MKILLAFLLTFSFIANAFAYDNYICRTIKSTGFHGEYGTWMPIVFSDIITFTINHQVDGYYSIHRDGQPTVVSDPSYGDEFILGYSAFHHFVLDKSTMMFTFTDVRGYVRNLDNGTPYIIIGKCKINN